MCPFKKKPALRALTAALLFALAAAQTSTAIGFAVLQNVQSQQTPDGRVKIFLSFNGNVGVVPAASGATPTYVLRIPDAGAAPTVPGIIPVNAGLVQGITIGQSGTSLTISVILTQRVKPALMMRRRGLIEIDVPATANNVRPFLRPDEGGGETQRTVVIRVRYADVAEIAGVLSGSEVTPQSFAPTSNQLGPSVSEGAGGGITPGLLPGSATQGLQNQIQTPQYPPSQTQQEPAAAGAGQRVNETVAIDRRLNAVILTGTSQQITDAEKLVAQLDVPIPSVLLDTRVLEVTESGAKAIGLDWGQVAGAPLAHIYNKAFADENQLPPMAGVALQTNIFLLVNNGKARLLGSPRILTQSGVPASILTGDSLPIRTTTPVGVGGVGALSTQVQYINVGVNLQILPRVTGTGQVQADIFADVSSLTGFSSAGDPQISTRQTQTRVDLVEGETLMIGGLIQQRDIRNVQKIPVLGDIPILGSLFRLETQTREDTNLVITITPHIVPAPAH